MFFLRTLRFQNFCHLDHSRIVLEADDSCNKKHILIPVHLRCLHENVVVKGEIIFLAYWLIEPGSYISPVSVVLSG